MLFGPPPEGSTPEPSPAERTCTNCGAALNPEYLYCTNCGTRPVSAGHFCTRCGVRLEPGHRFCTNCGMDVAIEPRTEVVPVNYGALESGEVAPTVRIEGTRVTLNGVEDPQIRGFGASPGNRLVAFSLTVTNEEAAFTSVGLNTFRLEDTFGETRRPVESPLSFDTLVQGERVRIIVIFEIDDLADPLSLTYAPGFAQFAPFGEKVRFEFH